MMESALSELRKLAIGGTAVGTGLNAPDNFDTMVCEELTSLTGTEFVPDNNKFHCSNIKGCSGICPWSFESSGLQSHENRQ